MINGRLWNVPGAAVAAEYGKFGVYRFRFAYFLIDNCGDLLLSIGICNGTGSAVGFAADDVFSHGGTAGIAAGAAVGSRQKCRNGADARVGFFIQIFSGKSQYQPKGCA